MEWQCLCYPMPIVCPGLCYWTHVECIYKSQFLSAYLILHGCDQLVKSKLKNDERLSIAALNTLNTATPATVGCSPSRIFCSTLQKHVGIRKPFLAGFHTRKLLKEVPARRACHLSQLGPKKKDTKRRAQSAPTSLPQLRPGYFTLQGQYSEAELSEKQS